MSSIYGDVAFPDENFKQKHDGPGLLSMVGMLCVSLGLSDGISTGKDNWKIHVQCNAPWLFHCNLYSLFCTLIIQVL